MIAAVSTFTCLDTTSKYLAQHYPVPAIVWARYVVHMVLMALVLGPRMRLTLLRTRHLRLQIIRGIVLAASSLVFLSALSLMPLAEAAAIAFMTPIIIAALAGPVLGERVERRTWLALAGGFVGVLLIVRPGGGLFTPAALLPLASAFMMALYQMMTSKLAGRDAPLTTLFYPAVIGSALVPLVFPHELMLPGAPLHAGLFVLIGVLGGFGLLLVLLRHRRDEGMLVAISGGAARGRLAWPLRAPAARRCEIRGRPARALGLSPVPQAGPRSAAPMIEPITGRYAHIALDGRA